MAGWSLTALTEVKKITIFIEQPRMLNTKREKRLEKAACECISKFFVSVSSDRLAIR